MRAVVQRVSEAAVVIDGATVGQIGGGVLVLVGIAPEDGAPQARWLAEKVAHLRIFTDDAGRMNRSLLDVGGAALVVSQFTLYGDARKGRRPSFIRGARGPAAQAEYEAAIAALEDLGVRCESGRFGAMMDVSLVNAGPVTILLDSDKTF
jgi:D-tyrosyl-tRNA(Tyr) deacylase